MEAQVQNAVEVALNPEAESSLKQQVVPQRRPLFFLDEGLREGTDALLGHRIHYASSRFA